MVNHLLPGVAGLQASPTLLAWCAALLLAVAGVIVLAPRRRPRPGPSAREIVPPPAEQSLPPGQWQRLARVIEAGAACADAAGRTHHAADNAILAVQHDLDALNAELARLAAPAGEVVPMGIAVTGRADARLAA